MWELDHKESWAPKNWCFWTVVLEKILESPLDCQEMQPVHSKGNQSWIFIGRTDVKVETPKLWPPDAKSWLIWKDPNAGKDWRWKEKGMIEDEMVGWHLSGHEFEKTPGDTEGQESLACCSPCVAKNWTQLRDWTIPRAIYIYLCIIYKSIIYLYLYTYMCVERETGREQKFENMLYSTRV